jgi:serine/threonine protein kinase
MVLDRGLTLSNWLEVERMPSAVWAMIGEVLTLLATLHKSGNVHRDLKPDNLVLVYQTMQWRVLDFGIASTVGMCHSSPLCTHVLCHTR